MKNIQYGKKTERKKILTVLNRFYLTVIATANAENANPECALVAYVFNDKLELFFQTNRYSRKAVNLRQNPHVAFVMGLALNDLVTVQYQGRATQLTGAKEIEECRQMFIDRKSPTASPKYLEHPDAIYFKIVPTWIACCDYSQAKPHVIELHFT